jgi:hypothetical protein
MKILVVASLTPPATANYLISALRDAKHEVFVCSDVASPLANQLVYGAVDVARVCSLHGFTPELMLFIEGGTMRLLPTGLENLSCLTAWYGIDTHMDYAKHLRIGRLFDVTFIAQKEFVEKLHSDGLQQVHWLPLGFAPELMPSSMPARTIDIAYVGSNNVVANPQRHVLLSALQREFSSTRFGPATPQEMGGIYASARMVFNRSVKNDVNMRFFEAAGSGAVLVTGPVVDNGVEALFEEGKHYVVYHDEASLLNVVRDLLADPARCATMGETARQHVLACHTYCHRAASLLKVAEQSKKLPAPHPEDYFSACLSLNLLSGALDAAGRAMAFSSGGAYRRIMGGTAAFVLYGLAGVLGMVERARAHFLD